MTPRSNWKRRQLLAAGAATLSGVAGPSATAVSKPPATVGPTVGPAAVANTALPHTATPLPIAIRIDTRAPLHAANPLLVGSNTPWVYGSEGLMDESGAYRPGMLERAQQMAPTVLRYPGVPDTYHWRQGIGPLALRQPVFAYPGQPFQKIVFGTQEFLETCEALGAIPLFEVNMHDGDDASLAKQAADWVRYVNRQPQISRRTGKPLPKGLYWELGNEPYLMEARLADGSPNRLFMRGELYARRASVVMAAMREVDPGIRIGLPFALDTHSGRPWRNGGTELATVVGEHLGYADKMLAGLARPQDLQFLALHYYMPLITGPTDANGRPLLLPATDEALHWGAMAGAETIRRHLAAVDEFWRQHPKTARLPPPRILVTEYNSFFTNGKYQGKDQGKNQGEELKQNAYVMTQAGALFVADLLRMMSMEPRIEAALQWSLTNNWVFGAIAARDGRSEVFARPVFHAMRLFRSLLDGGRMLDPRVTVATTSRASTAVSFAAPYPEMPLATAAAARNGKTLKIIVINKDPARPGRIELALQGDRAVSARVEYVQAKGLFDAPGTPQASTPISAPVAVDAAGQPGAVTLPPASFGLVSVVLR